MSYEFDHFFILTEVGAPAMAQVLALGLKEGQPNVHPGQGTACRRIFFHNAMLEFLWVVDSAAVQGEPIAPTRLWERSRPQQSGYAPFGLCFRPGGGPAPKSLFATWAYRPPYLPAGVQIEVADNGAYPAEPMIFTIPFGGRPDGYLPEKRQPLDHPLGFKEITRVTLTLTPSEPRSTAVKTIASDSLVSFKNGPTPLAEIFFDDATIGGTADFRPALPLIFHW